jgi:hypothetical protein
MIPEKRVPEKWIPVFRSGSCANREFTIREQAIAETPACSLPCGPGSALPLSYRRIRRRAGLEPATSRVSDEVTAIFTTDRDGVGGEQAMLSLPGKGTTELRHCCRRASNHATSGRANGRRSHRSNRHLHHRRPRCLAARRRFDGHAGEQAISAFSESTQGLLSETPALWRVATLARAPPQCVTSKAGVEPAFPVARSIRHLHHQRRSSRISSLRGAKRRSNPVFAGLAAWIASLRSQ